MSDSSISNISTSNSGTIYSNQNTNSAKEAKTNASTESATKNVSEESKTPALIKDNAEGVSSNKVLQENDLPKLDLKTVNTLKSYGVTINPENLKLIAAIMKNMPGKVNMGDLLGLLISKKIPLQNADMVGKYINGSINFSALFANLSDEALNELRASWNTGKLLEKLQNLVKLANTATSAARATENKELAKEVVDNLRLQELFSQLPDANNDGNIYFQWPVFWGNQDLPDCLEGEAFFPNKDSPKEGFCLRILVNPPNLGQTEISLITREKELYVHFGVDERFIDTFRTIFNPIRENILALGNYTSVHFTISKGREHRNFFSHETKTEMKNTQRNSKIDFKA